MDLVGERGLRGTLFSAKESGCERPGVGWGGEETEAGVVAVGEVGAEGSHLRSWNLTNEMPDWASIKR